MVTIAQGHLKGKKGAILFSPRPLRLVRAAFFFLIFIAAGAVILASLMLDRTFGKEAVSGSREPGVRKTREVL